MSSERAASGPIEGGVMPARFNSTSGPSMPPAPFTRTLPTDPYRVVGERGQVQYEWHIDGIDIEVTFDASGRFDGVLVDRSYRMPT